MPSYAKTLDNIFALSKGLGVNPSLHNIEKLCEIYNHPQNSFKTIHVAGTNGKGSVCTKIATALQEEGYLCGLYTSPHISSFRERIKIGGTMIPEEEISLFFIEVEEKMRKFSIAATFFEITTLIAFLYFQKRKVDVAVIETGLGGRWDATNVIYPLISVITSIGYDHMEILGPTLEDIAKEKGGIIKKRVPVVIGPDVSYPLMQKIAEKEGSALYQSTFRNSSYDLENQGTTHLALSLLHSDFSLSQHSIEKGLSARPSCRFEQYVREKEVIFDVAHNPHGFARLLDSLSTYYPKYHYRFLVGFSKGKDVAKCAQLIQEKAVAIHLVSGEHPRLAKVDEFKKAFASYKGPLHVEHSIIEGIYRALHLPTRSPEVLVICGSFFIMCEARKALGIQDIEDPCLCYDPLKTSSSVENYAKDSI